MIVQGNDLRNITFYFFNHLKVAFVHPSTAQNAQRCDLFYFTMKIIFGKGFSYTEFIFKENYHRLSRLGHEGNAHNSYLTIWLDTGIVGLFTFIVPLILLVVQAAKKTAVAMPFLFAIIFSTYFESWLTASLNPFTIVFLVVLSIITSAHRSDESDRKNLIPIQFEP